MLKDVWTDKVDGVDVNSAEDINQVANATIALEKSIEEIKKNQTTVEVDSELSESSENPLQNKVVTANLKEIKEKNSEISLDVKGNTDSIKNLQYYGDANIIPSDASLFLFSYMDANMTARAGANSTDISGDIVIPYEIYAVGIEAEGIYKVTATRPDGFEDCKNLTGVILPYGITSIKSATFRNCTNLKSITIPKGIKTIDLNAFSGCENLKSVYFRGTRENWNDISIGANNEALLNATIYYEWSDITKDYVDEKVDALASEVQDAITVANEAKDGVQENLMSIIELQTQVGNIDTALAKIITLQNSLIGGDA